MKTLFDTSVLIAAIVEAHPMHIRALLGMVEAFWPKLHRVRVNESRENREFRLRISSGHQRRGEEYR
jgi:hypothetical protein